MDWKSEDFQDVKVLVATPNYTNLFTSEVHTNHIECAVKWKEWGIEYNWTIVGRTFVHFARTQAMEAMVAGGFTHIFWVDDDAIVPPELLPRFLKHDKEIMIAPYPMRRPKHEIGVLISTVGDFHNHESYRNLNLSDMDQGVIEVDGGGTHCMLVKRDVVDARGGGDDSPDPYPEDLKELLDSLNTDQRKKIDHYVGNLPDEHMSLLEENDELKKPYFMMPKSGTEDMYFCYRAKKKGVKIWCDTDVFSGHVGFYPVITRKSVEHYDDSTVALSQVPEDAQPAHKPGPSGQLSGMRSKSVDSSASASLV